MTLNSKHIKIFTLALALVTFVAFQTASAKPNGDTPKQHAASKDIVDTAVAAGSFNTLAKALQAAGLIDALKAAGPFTVFAPTDEAFAKLPAGTVEELLKPENKDKLRAILLYHVVKGQYNAASVTKLNGKSVKTLQGTKVMVRTGDNVMVDDASVVKTDVFAKNGVIHVIDTVLMPKESMGN